MCLTRSTNNKLLYALIYLDGTLGFAMKLVLQKTVDLTAFTDIMVEKMTTIAISDQVGE